jgi:hypothetical protein
MPLQCQTERAPDYYGLGVRLGIYFAWWQAYIANTMLPSELAGAADTNTIFLLTILVAMIQCTHSHMLQSIDGLILMHLSGGTIFGILSIWGYRTRQYIDEGVRGIRFFGGFGTHARIVISLAVSIYGLWFWLYGVTGSLIAMGGPGDETTDPAPNPPDCSTLYTFMFSPVRADGGVRIFYIVICVGCAVYFGIMLLASTIAGWARVSKIVELYKAGAWADTSRLRFATGLTYRELEVAHKALRVLNFLWLVWSMLLVEMTLNYNHVSAVLGGPTDNELHLPAQLLPLLIGAFGFVRILYKLLEDRRGRGDVDPSLAHDPAPPSPKAARTMHLDKAFAAFSPAMAKRAPTAPHDPAEVDPLERRRSRALRYLVAWLPWLSLLQHFQGPEGDEEKRGNEERTEKQTSGAGIGPSRADNERKELKKP